MAKTRKTKAKAAEARRIKPKSTTKDQTPDAKVLSAIALLKQDHRDVEEYFDEYEGVEAANKKKEIADKICNALIVHAQIEEEIFYPKARKATEDDDLLDEATVEHACAKDLIAQIQGMKVGDELYDAKIKVLGEMIKHHVKEEEEELFPETKSADMDMEAIGKQLAHRKRELMAEVEARAKAA